MHAKRMMCITVSVFLCGCASIDGLYAPACIAYEGDEIELLEGRFTWRRFTDQRTLDEQGQRVDPFPGYPRSGVYEYRDPVLILTPNNDSGTTEFFLLNDNQGTYLLTAAEKRQFDVDDGIPECALRRTVEN